MPARVFQHMQFCHQALWPQLDVQLVSATEQWAQFSVAGPRARDTLARIVDAPFDIGNEALPFMAVAEMTVCGGVTARLYRISFSGELAYEIGVPARYGDALARKLMEAGAEFGIAPYGTEALGVMRIEKGHPAGNELDGRTTARDLGFGRMMSTKKDCIGRVLAGRPALLDPERPSLVGFKPVDPKARLRAGAHLFRWSRRRSRPMIWASSPRSRSRPRSITGSGSACSRADRRCSGERVRAVDPVRNGDVEVEVCAPCFIDPQGERLRGYDLARAPASTASPFPAATAPRSGRRHARVAQ